MQVPFRHKEDKTATYVVYGSKKYHKLNKNPVWECLVLLSDDEKQSLDAEILRKKEERASHSIDNIFKTGGAGLLLKLHAARYTTIDSLLDSTPEEISKLSGMTLGKAESIYNGAKSYMALDV